MLRIIMLALALAGCANTSSPGSFRSSIERERADEHGQALRDDFNRMTNDAY